MKILNVSNIFFTLPYFFGDQLSYFTKKGYDITLVCSPDPNLAAFANKHGCKYRELFIPRVFAPLQDLKACWELFRFISNQKFDVVCGHTPIGGFIAMCAASLARVPKRVFFRHGLVYETSYGLKRIIFIAAEKLASKLATKVVCVSPYLIERSLADNLTSRDKIILLGKGSCNGVDSMGKFNPDLLDYSKLKQLRESLSIPEDSFVIGYSGRMVKDKGIEELIAAFKMIHSAKPNSYLLLVGMLEERDAISMESVKEIKNNPFIIHTGLVLNDIEYYYSLMDVLVLCTHREGLGIVLLEAASMNIPTLTTKHTGSKDAICENVTGMFIEMNNASSIVEKVLTYMNDEQLRTLHGKQGREFVQKYFNQEFIWSEIENKVYKNR